MKQRVPKFLCLGLIMRDILISGVPELPTHWEQTQVGKAVRSDTGGGAANSARTLGRLGALVSLSGRIGKDSFAAQVKRDLEADAVDLSFLKEDADNPSGVAVALIRQDGKRCFTTVRGANQAYCEEDLASICWEAFPFVLVNGFFQFPALEPELPRLMEQMKAAGCCIAFDTASWDPSGRWFERIRPFARFLDYLFANGAQLYQLTKKENLQEASSFLQGEGVGAVVAKLGAQGSVTFCRDGGQISVPAFPVKAADTSGAGDSFDAAYLFGKANGWLERECAQFANTVAGLNCTRIGATAGVPGLDTALRLCRNCYGTFTENHKSERKEISHAAGNIYPAL